MARKKTDTAPDAVPTPRKPRAPRATAGTATTKPAAPRAKPTKKSELELSQRLVLQTWALDQLGENFESLAADLKKVTDTGAGGTSPYAKRILTLQSMADEGRRKLGDEAVHRFDANLRRHTDDINRKRDPRVRWKYFQWLALFFTEMYLDRWFTDPTGFLAELNAVVARHNEGEFTEGVADGLPEFGADDLRRLAFWCATGSGKTLLLHMHLRQYRAYSTQHQRKPANVILVCPREDLARQHLEEFAASGIDAEYFEPRGLLHTPGAVRVMEVTRLREEGKKKTVDVGQFGEDNLVFIDEAHLGLRGDDSVWKEYRDRLSARGFAFEYSATFGQAVKAAKGDEAAREYARCILLDYSYKRFYADGYGKDYSILNLKKDPTGDLRQRYLVGCLLWFYQQLRVYEDTGAALGPYQVDRPLWVFVGGRVTGSDDGLSLPEVVEILVALQRVVSQPGETVGHLAALLGERSGILDDDDRDVFAGFFPALLRPVTPSAEEVHQDILRRVFRVEAPGPLHLHLLRGSDHELVLEVSAGKPFGVVYVGKAREVEKLCRESTLAEGLVVDPPVPGESLFAGIHRPDSRVHLLIGSRKFTEGWNSWRVSTLGLMNFGRGEGSQVIQLFGRGVRLRGYLGGLRRSTRLKEERKLPATAPTYLPLLETFGVFGLRADYMAAFRDYLKDEGLKDSRRPAGSLAEPVDDAGGGGVVRVNIPIRVTVPEHPPLYTFVTEDVAGDRATWPRVLLDLPGDDTGTRWIEKHPVVLDWYPVVESERSQGAPGSKQKRARDRVTLEPRHVAWLDIDGMVRELLQQREARERDPEREERREDWCPLAVTREGVLRLLAAPEKWYELYLPRELLEFRTWEDVERWRDIATTLLGEYCEKFMLRWWDGQEQATMRYAPVTHADPNFEMNRLPPPDHGWTVEIRGGDTEAGVWQTRYEGAREAPERDHTWAQSEENWPAAGSIAASEHLFTPLLVLKRNPTIPVKTTPVSLDHSEAQFVRDLRAFWAKRPDWLAGCTLHLLRNQVFRGVRFFEANNFTPDFLVWLTRDVRQCVAVVDPKGIRELGSLRDPKFALHELIKHREAEVWRRSAASSAPPDVEAIRLESFIVANTRKRDVPWSDGDPALASLDQWFEHHVVFQHEDADHYVERILRAMSISLDDPSSGGNAGPTPQ